MEVSFEKELDWVSTQMPLVRQAITGLPDLTGKRIAFSIHLDIKIVPLLEGLLKRGAQIFLTTCSSSTVRNQVVEYLDSCGAETEAWHEMSSEEFVLAHNHALDWQPTHLCEMGAELSAILQQRQENQPPIEASMEGTGSGINRLANFTLNYPVFNWDELPIKEGLHNRYLVGLSTWQAFFERTRLTLHGKRVLVIGYGNVGRGVADSARAFGGTVSIAERDPIRSLEAEYAGWKVVTLEDAISEADVVVTATGKKGVLDSQYFGKLKDGVFLINVGHCWDEIDVTALLKNEHREVIPFVEAINYQDKTIYLFASGAMANLTAGFGDSLNAFDVTLAVMASGITYMVKFGSQFSPRVHLLPHEAWESYIRRVQ